MDNTTNTGDYNTGYYNTGYWNTGLFNTNEPFMRCFNKETTIKLGRAKWVCKACKKDVSLLFVLFHESKLPTIPKYGESKT